MEELPDSDEDDEDFAPSESDSKAEPSSSASTSTDASFSSTRVEPSRSPQVPDDKDLMDMDTEMTRATTQTFETGTDEVQAASGMQALETEKRDYEGDETTEDMQGKGPLLETNQETKNMSDDTGLVGNGVAEKRTMEKVSMQ